MPDLLGSILSGQSMLLMDSSDVVINRDGSLKATKPSKCVWYRQKSLDSFVLSPPVEYQTTSNELQLNVKQSVCPAGESFFTHSRLIVTNRGCSCHDFPFLVFSPAK